MLQPAHTYAITAVDWNVFCTLTVRDIHSENALLRQIKRWLRWVASVERVTYDELLFVIRLERGEAGGRLHSHILLKVNRSFTHLVVPRGMVSQGHRRWQLGMTSFRYVSSNEDSAIPYMLKDTCGANEYEMKKTATCEEIVLSQALFRIANRASKGKLSPKTGLAACHTGGQDVVAGLTKAQ